MRARRLGLLVVFLRKTWSKDGKYESAMRLRMAERRVYTRGGVEYESKGTWGNEVLEELDPKPNVDAPPRN